MKALSRIDRRRPTRCQDAITNRATMSRSVDRNTRNIDKALPLAAVLSLLMTAAIAQGGEATTSASANSNGMGPGTASATANYSGRGQGFARTRTQSGNLSFGRGVAFGIDRNGVNFSTSSAFAPALGPAVASNFNLSVAFNGEVSGSHGLSVAGGSRQRSAHAGGSSKIRRGRATSISRAGGRTARRGFVRARTRSRASRGVPRWRW